MHPLMSPELAELRRRDLLREAERDRRASRARSALRAVVARGSPRRGWRVVAGVVLVRLGVRLGGEALTDAMVVVPARGARPAVLAVVWRDHGGGPPRGAGVSRPRRRPPAFSRW
jgi:hypothetical protein